MKIKDLNAHLHIAAICDLIMIDTDTDIAPASIAIIPKRYCAALVYRLKDRPLSLNDVNVNKLAQMEVTYTPARTQRANLHENKLKLSPQC